MRHEAIVYHHLVLPKIQVRAAIVPGHGRRYVYYQYREFQHGAVSIFFVQPHLLSSPTSTFSLYRVQFPYL